MFEVNIDEKYIINQHGTSEGAQIKYYKDGFWYKIDNRGNEGLAEYLVSSMLRFSSLEDNEYVLYEQGIINGKPGCRSKNFLDSNNELVTIYRLYMNEYGRNLAEVIASMETMDERIEYVVRFIKECCGFDIKEYFSKVFTLDAIVLNEDRHFNNLALIAKDNSFEPAPLFDNGISLLTANLSVSAKASIEDNVKRVVARPFSGSFKNMREYFGDGFSLDVEGALDWLSNESPSFERDVLIYQLKQVGRRTDFLST